MNATTAGWYTLGLGILVPKCLLWLGWAALLVRVGLDHRPRLTRWAPVLLAVFVGALALRLNAPAVQHDINPRTDDVWTGWGMLEWRYTHGLTALFRLPRLIGVVPDDLAVFHTVAAAGAASVVLVGALATRLGGPIAGLAAAVMLGGLGLHVRYSHTDAPQIVELTLELLAALLLTTRRREPAASALVVASLVLAATMRPESFVAVAVFVAAAAAAGAGWTRRELGQLTAGVVLVALPDVVTAWVMHGGPIARGNRPFEHGLWTYGTSHLAAFNAAFVPPLIGWGAMLAPLVAPRRRVALAVVLLALVSGALIGEPFWSIGGLPSWCLARHQLRLLPWLAVAVGLVVAGVSGRLGRRLDSLGFAVGLAACLGLGALVRPTLTDAWAPWTLSEEYTFFRTTLPTIPSGCTVFTLDGSGDHGLAPRTMLSGVLGRDHRWQLLTDPLPASGCVVYYRPAICTSHDPKGPVTDVCLDWERQHVLEPLTTASLVSRGWLWEAYEDPVRVGFYRVVVASGR